MSKRGLSTIVATLLILLLVMVAVGIIWIVVRNVIQSGTEQISLGKYTLDLQIEQVQKVDDSNINVKLKRNAGDGEFVGISFIIDDGDSTEVIKQNISLKELEVKTFQLILSGINASNIKKISIYPIFKLESGKEIVGPMKDEYTVSSSTSSGISTCTPYCPTGAVCGSDGCGGSCGTCSGSTPNCINYQCSANTCTPSCVGKTCGDDGCGGSCGNCLLANSVSTCSASYSCVISSCSTGYANCDSNTTNGCETLLGTITNCASCGNQCSTGQTCTNNVCVTPSTPTTWQTGIVSWWNLNGNTQDSVGTNHGTNNGATLLSSGCVSGSCYDFDGSNDYIRLPDVDALQMETKSFTILAWIYPESYAEGSWGGIIGGESGAASLGLQTDGSLRTTEANIEDGPDSTLIPTLNSWNFVAITFNSVATTNNIVYYLNGNPQIFSWNNDFTDSAASYDIGARLSGTTDNFNGRIDEVIIWNRVLNSTEISAAYNSFSFCTPNCAGKSCGDDGCGGSCGTCSTGYNCNASGICVTSSPAWQTGMVSWWKLNENAQDSVGTNHGTPAGVTSTSTNCKAGQCYLFDSNSDYITLTSSITSTVATYSFWVRVTDVSDDRLIMGDDPYYKRIFLTIERYPRIETNTNGQEFQFYSSPLTINTLSHIVLSRNGDSVSYYLNGNFATTTTVSGANSMTISQIGYNGRSFRGTIDEVMIWNRSLSASEISQVYSYNYS